MAQVRRSFQRQLGERPYKRIFLLSFEGSRTEPQYFAHIDSMFSHIRIKPLKTGTRTSPRDVLKRLQKHITKESLKETDEAWLIIDRDNWPENDIQELQIWSQRANNYNLAISNPKFEYWLLLHFEDGNRLSSAADCCRRLENYLPNYNKHIDRKKFDLEKIKLAVKNGKLRDTPPAQNWEVDLGVSTVYKLIEKIIA